MGPPPGASATAASKTTDPIGAHSLFDAVSKQLGLKSEKQRRPVPVLVIDHIEEKPTENETGKFQFHRYAAMVSSNGELVSRAGNLSRTFATCALLLLEKGQHRRVRPLQRIMPARRPVRNATRTSMTVGRRHRWRMSCATRMNTQTQSSRSQQNTAVSYKSPGLVLAASGSSATLPK